jgi:anti-anti-sigma factor
MSEEPGSLEVQSTTEDDTTIVRVSGEVDLHTSPQLRALLLEAVATSARSLMIDLAEVSYMDSSGVGTLVYVKREVEQAGGRLVLVGPQPRVLSVLEITHLDKFFTIAGSVDEARSA